MKRKIYKFVLYLFMVISSLLFVTILWTAINNAALISDMCFQFTSKEYTFTLEEVSYFVNDLLFPLLQICLVYIFLSIVLMALLVKFCIK